MCGKVFIMHSPSGKANRGEVNEGRFCSRKCRWDKERKPIEAKHLFCRICGNEMNVVYGVLCSESCRKEANRRTGRERIHGENGPDDNYVRMLLRRQQQIEATPKTIELKRQQIMMKRTLKEFKKWRQENESNHANVHGEQRPHETDHEGRL
jgi:hypothetical protein